MLAGPSVVEKELRVLMLLQVLMLLLLRPGSVLQTSATRWRALKPVLLIVTSIAVRHLTPSYGSDVLPHPRSHDGHAAPRPKTLPTPHLVVVGQHPLKVGGRHGGDGGSNLGHHLKAAATGPPHVLHGRGRRKRR